MQYSSNDKAIQKMKFTQYLDSPGIKDNALVRSILCKTEGQITMDDINKAETFLKYQVHVSIANKCESIVQLFQKRFRPNLDSQKVWKCIEDEYRRSVREDRYLTDDLFVYLEEMYRSNFYDFSIYHNFARKKVINLLGKNYETY